jgi:hypothetical protein
MLSSTVVASELALDLDALGGTAVPESVTVVEGGVSPTSWCMIGGDILTS